MGAILTICLKDLRLLCRDRAGLFFTFAFPFLYALFFGYVFSGGSGKEEHRIPARLVDLDHSAASAAFLDSLAAGPSLVARRDSLASAELALRKGEVSVVVVVKAGFGRASQQLFGTAPPELDLLHDPSRQAELGLVQGLLMEQAFRALVQRVENPATLLPVTHAWQDSLALAPDAPPHLKRWAGELNAFLSSEAREDSTTRVAGRTSSNGSGLGPWEPLRIHSRALSLSRGGPQSAFEISFPQGLLWGIISVTASFGISLVVERREGTLRRLRAAPLGPLQILAGKALACFLTILALVALLVLVGRPLGVVAERPLFLVLGALCIAWAFTGLMLLIAVLGRTERAVSGFGWSLLTVLAMLGGGMVPLFFMPDWMRALASISPVKWAILAMEGALWRGFAWAELLPVCAVLLAVGAGCAFIGLKAFRWSDA